MIEQKFRYGLRGIRVGEASHQGPRRLRLLLVSQSERSPALATIPESSGQIRGVQGDVLSTVPASSGAVAAAVNPCHFRVDSDSELELRERENSRSQFRHRVGATRRRW